MHELSIAETGLAKCQVLSANSFVHAVFASFSLRRTVSRIFL